MPVVYGVPLDGVEVVEVPFEAGHVFAAHRRVVNEPAGVHLGDGTSRRRGVHHERTRASVIEAIDAAERPVVLAGPGVVLHHAVEGLRALRRAASVGVLNTWGAKGVFDWRSPHHLATAGLQARDFERGGLADADLIIATGLDEREVLAEWRARAGGRRGAVVARAAGRAHPAARARDHGATAPRGARARHPGRAGQRTVGPLPPTKVTQHYSQVLGDGGLVAADPGTAGYWVARTFATQQLGGVQVTADRDQQGFAVACATVARLADPAPARAGGGGPARRPDVGRRSRRRPASGSPCPSRCGTTAAPPSMPTPTRPASAPSSATAGRPPSPPTRRQLDEMLAVAGPIVAWTR